MTNILVNGILGHMGKAICAVAEASEDVNVVCGVDRFEDPSCTYPVFTSYEAVDVPFDVVVDFSSPAALEKECAFCLARKAGLVVGTTGLSEKQISLISETAKSVPVFRSANMSLGVNLQTMLSRIAAATLGSDFDVEIVERHHRLKVDAPSGTALMLADAVSDALPEKPEYVYDRHDKREKRSNKEIGIHSVRGGTIVGEHEVSFIGNDEVITITHQAFSKRIFAEGAVKAAAFLHGQKPGLYNMQDVIK